MSTPPHTKTPSHRLKLDRAYKHLKELDLLLESARERRPYPVMETVEAYRKQPAYVYTLALDAVKPPDDFPIIFGDFLFNVRSALDHLMVAIAPNKRKGSTEFRICTSDPLAKNEASGEYLHREEAARWLSVTKGLPHACVTALQGLQPYERARMAGTRSEDHPLAVLGALHNADKHRWLIGVITALNHAEVDINGEVLGSVPALVNGAVICRSPSPMQVKVERSVVIGVSGRDKLARDVEKLAIKVIAYVDFDVFPILERFL